MRHVAGGRAVGLFLGLASFAAGAQVTNFDSPTRVPPLNSPVVYSRTLETVKFDCASCSAQVLSLVMELKNDSARPVLHPWPLFIQLTTNHDRGDATGAYSRIFSNGAGWSAGLHAETIHAGTGTSIGSNIEQSNMSNRGRVIGVNIQAKNGYGGVAKNFWSEEAINIQSAPGAGWKSGLKFNAVSLEKGIVFDAQTSGKTAIEIGGRFERGIDLNGNAIFLGRGGRIVLDEEEQVVMLFNRETRQIEIRVADDVLASFPLKAKNRAQSAEIERP